MHTNLVCPLLAPPPSVLPYLLPIYSPRPIRHCYRWKRGRARAEGIGGWRVDHSGLGPDLALLAKEKSEKIRWWQLIVLRPATKHPSTLGNLLISRQALRRREQDGERRILLRRGADMHSCVCVCV